MAFQMRFEESDLAGYLKDHETVWPEMQQALRDCGWHNYSLFFREDGFALGYFETETSGFSAACALMDETAINATWQSAMTKYTPANVVPIDAAMELEHYFYLGDDRIAGDGPAMTPDTADWSPQPFTGGVPTKAGLNRICFQMQFNPAELGSYLADHEAVWPEMQQALVATGWHNYSLFYREDGFACGFFETDASSLDEACARMDKLDVNATWQTAMAKYTPPDAGDPLTAARQLTHYFYLGVDQ